MKKMLGMVDNSVNDAGYFMDITSIIAGWTIYIKLAGFDPGIAA